MDRKVFISFLGSSFYGKCCYASKDFTSSETRFVQQATLEWIKNNEGCFPDVSRILVTKGETGSKESNWNKNISVRSNSQSKKNEQYSGLEKVLEEMGIKATAIDIPDGKDEFEIWGIFETILGQLKKGDELYLDLTHGYRYMPMLLLVLSDFAKKTKQTTVAHISYGNFEGRDKEKNIAQFVDLLPLKSIQEEKGIHIEKIKQSYIDKVQNTNPFNNLKILVCGATDRTVDDIWKLIKDALKKKFNIDPPKRILDTPFLDYDEAKKSNVMDLIMSNKYDYIIWGPSAHNISGKGAKTGIDSICSDNNLKAKLFVDQGKRMGTSFLKTTANQIAEEWYNCK
jgi:CRISPR-associated Csx2 family protein